MRYVWDKAKRESNLKKHDVDFVDAAFVLEDTLALSKTFTAGEELRWKTLGVGDKPGVLLVIHAEEGEDAIAIISARRADRSERRQYYEGAWDE